MEYIASIKSKVIRYPSGGDNKWMHSSSDSVGYGMLQSDIDTLLAMDSITVGQWTTQSAEVAEQYDLNPDGARYIDRLIDLVEYCDSVNGFKPKVIYVANVTMSRWLPSIYNVWGENLEAIRYLIDNGVDVVGIEMGNEHYDDENLFETFIDYWWHIRPLLDSLQDDTDLNSIPISLTAAPEPDFAELFSWSPGSVQRFKDWNTGLAGKSGSPKFDAYTVHIYNTSRMMEPCYQAYTDDYYNIDPDDPIVFDPDLGPDPYITASWQCALDSFENFVNDWLPYIFNHYTIIDDSTYRLGTDKRYWVTEWGVKPPSEEQDPLDPLYGNFNNTFVEAAFSMEYLLKLLEIQGASMPIDIEFATKHNTLSGYTYGLISTQGVLDPVDEPYYKRASYYSFVINENIFSTSYERVNASPVLLDGSYVPFVRGYFNEGSDLFYMCFVNGSDDTVKFAIHEMTGDTTALGYGSLTPSSSYGCYIKHIRATQLYGHGGMNQYMLDNSFYNDTTIAPLIDSIYFTYKSTFSPDSMVSLPPYSLGWVKWQVSPIPDRLTAQFDNIQVSTWPNPANDIVNFSIETFTNEENKFTVSVYNILGEKVSEMVLSDNSAEWHCANEVNGIYIYELTCSGIKLGTGKIILQ